MKSINIKSSSSNETMNIAKIFAKHLTKGDTIVLTGELGSGKTKFTEGFLGYLDYLCTYNSLQKLFPLKTLVKFPTKI